MRQPPGFESPDTQLVCKLNKSLYGLKQSPRAWFDKFSKVVKMLGYSQGQAIIRSLSNTPIMVTLLFSSYMWMT
ncbi:Cysteine-rich RLK (receptor-like protein kinase) 8 [Dorcoceras hygrometricum]|uniref:Cysteine-rich RLK (Receptor-like protein kinase) 8 n=1 Tax=Dorcoceras hygrometricum TaxID=472368 RepID=A0A2Z7BTV9_9LAMI|nr:Cysteine-rich RLK (receptor-like protein kinase) 8 [Dorcoceras hygrometricum]